jgi:hypothetical protein
MPFNAESGKKAGKISKRGRALPLELRGSINKLVNDILNDIDYKTLTNSQKIKLLDVALKYSLPKLSIEKPYEEKEAPQEFQITIVGDDGTTETHTNVLDENFSFSNMAGGNTSK